MWTEKSDVFVAYQTTIHQTVDHHAIVQVTDAVFLNTTVVFQYQKALNFEVPDWVVRCRRAATNAALGARLHCGLEMFQERDNASVNGFAIADLTAQRTQTTKADTNTCTAR